MFEAIGRAKIDFEKLPEAHFEWMSKVIRERHSKDGNDHDHKAQDEEEDAAFYSKHLTEEGYKLMPDIGEIHIMPGQDPD